MQVSVQWLLASPRSTINISYKDERSRTEEERRKNEREEREER